VLDENAVMFAATVMLVVVVFASTVPLTVPLSAVTFTTAVIFVITVVALQ